MTYEELKKYAEELKEKIDSLPFGKEKEEYMRLYWHVRRSMSGF